MSNEKKTISEQPATTPPPEVVNLELDENDDFGSDPYNHTGSHCVLKFDDDA